MRPRARYVQAGYLAVHPKAWGAEFLIFGGAEQAKAFQIQGPAAVVEICGPLTQHSVFFWDHYDAIRERARAAFESSAKCVVLKIDSPGGDAAGCFDLARELRAMAATTKKALYAFTDGMAASAAYAIACAAARVCVTSTGRVGSVGVYEVLVDVTAQDRAMGLNVVVVASGERKTDTNPHVPITKAAVEEMRGQVDGLAQLFYDLVGDMRGVTPDAVRALEGAMRFGAEAVAAGLADEVLTWPEFLSSLETAQPGASAQAGAASENKQMGKYLDEAKVALRRAAEDEGDDEMKKKAQKALKALDDGDGDEEKKKDDEAKAKAKAEEDEKKKKDEADAKAKAEKEESEAKAKAAAGAVSNAMALAEEVARLKAKDAARDQAEAKAKDETQRAALLAKRPDFSPEQRATLALVPIEAVAKAVESWPRATAAVGAAAAATVGAPVAGGERVDQYTPRLSAAEQTLLDKTAGPKANVPKRPVQVGTAFQMPANLSQAEAAAYVAELEKAGA